MLTFPEYLFLINWHWFFNRGTWYNIPPIWWLDSYTTSHQYIYIYMHNLIPLYTCYTEMEFITFRRHSVSVSGICVSAAVSECLINVWNSSSGVDIWRLLLYAIFTLVLLYCFGYFRPIVYLVSVTKKCLILIIFSEMFVYGNYIHTLNRDRWTEKTQ